MAEFKKFLAEQPVTKNAKHEYVSPDKKVEINVDFDDPEEREATIWFKCKSEDEVETLKAEHEDWIDDVFRLYHVDILDGNPRLKNGETEEGGLVFHLDFGSKEDEDD